MRIFALFEIYVDYWISGYLSLPPYYFMGSAAWLPNSRDCHKVEITKQSKNTYQIRGVGARREGSVDCLVLEGFQKRSFTDLGQRLGIASPLPRLS